MCKKKKKKGKEKKKKSGAHSHNYSFGGALTFYITVHEWLATNTGGSG